MSYSINGTTITLTRGDTFCAHIRIKNPDGTDYIPVEGDTIRFAMKENYSDERALLLKDIPIDSMQLIIEPEDTKPLRFGKYKYDIQITTKTGVVCTFIPKAQFIITEEVV